MPQVIHIRELFFKKKSSAKETSTDFETKVNSVLKSKNNNSEINSDLRLNNNSKTKSISELDNNHSLLYHERKNPSDSYSYKKKDASIESRKKLRNDLGILRLSSWYSSTLGFSLKKKSPAKEPSKNSKMKVNSILNFDNYIHNNKNLRAWGISASALLLLISLLNLCPVILSRTEAEAASKVSETTMQMTTDYESANLNLLVTDENGTFASSKEEDQARFAVTTNNYTGYTLTISGPENTNLINKDNEALTSISDIIDYNTFNTSSLYNNKWGYKPSKYNSITNVAFLPAPSESASTLDQTSSANSEKANDYTISLGARASYDTPSGVYTNTFVLSAVANAANYTVIYEDTTDDETVKNLPPSVTATSEETSVILSSQVPTRTGYDFAGWCLGAPTNDSAECDGSIYSPGASLSSIDETASLSLVTLYALWTPAKYSLRIIFADSNITRVDVYDSEGSGGTLLGSVSKSGASVSDLKYQETYYLSPVFLQSFGLSSWQKNTSAGDFICDLLGPCRLNPGFTIGAGENSITLSSKQLPTMQSIGTGYCTENAEQVYDTRDSKRYTIQRLKDGNCWMMENLSLGTNTLMRDFTSKNTNLPEGETISISTFRSWNRTSSGDDASYTVPKYSPVSGTDETSNTAYGVLYNFCAASVNTYCYESTDTRSYGDAEYDICPAGWRLPTGGQSGEFQNLYNNYNSYALMRASAIDGGAAFALAGSFYDGAAERQNAAGYYYSSSRGSYTGMYRLSLNEAAEDGITVRPVNFSSRAGGYAVRCVMKDPLKDAGVSTMQDFGNLSLSEKTTLLDSLDTNRAYLLSDSRDDQKYVVAKLADGNLWMIDALNLGATALTTDLTSSNTNIDYTIPASTFNSWLLTFDEPYSYDTGKFIPVTSANSSTGTDSDPVSGSKYGTLYNYYAASAGYVSDENFLSSAIIYDICPAGWRLPMITGTNDFSGLVNSGYDTYQLLHASLLDGGAAFSLGGNISSDHVLAAQGSAASYWSRSAYSTAGSTYALTINQPNFSVYGIRTNNMPRSIRCILETRTIEDVNYMQNLTSTIVANTDNLVTKSMTDSRDRKSYSVVKYGNLLWMTKNLSIGCNGSSISSQTLTPQSSAVSSSWPTPTLSLDKTDETSGCTTDDNSDCSSYDTPRMKCDSTYGAWYNYAAATAGIVTGNENTTEATSSICPLGWRLFTKDERDASNDFRDVFSPVAAGFYNDGVLGQTNRGVWWSSAINVNDVHSRAYLQYFSNGGLDVNAGNRRYGFYVRCVRAAS